MNKLKTIYTKYKNHIVIGVNLIFIFTVSLNLFDMVFYGISISPIMMWLYIIMLVLFGIISILENYGAILSNKLELSYEELEYQIENLEYQVECLSKQVDKYSPKVEHKELKEADEIIEFMNKVKP